MGIFFVQFQAVYGGSRAMTALLMGLVSGGMSLLCELFFNIRIFVLFIEDTTHKIASLIRDTSKIYSTGLQYILIGDALELNELWWGCLYVRFRGY